MSSSRYFHWVMQFCFWGRWALTCARACCSTGAGRGRAGLAAGGLGMALFTLSLSPGSRSSRSSHSSQGGSLPHRFLLVHHKAAKMEISNKSKSKARKYDIQPHLKQNSVLHRHVIWLHPRSRSTIAWHPGHLRHRFNCNNWV